MTTVNNFTTTKLAFATTNEYKTFVTCVRLDEVLDAVPLAILTPRQINRILSPVAYGAGFRLCDLLLRDKYYTESGGSRRSEYASWQLDTEAGLWATFGNSFSKPDIEQLVEKFATSDARAQAQGNPDEELTETLGTKIAGQTLGDILRGAREIAQAKPAEYKTREYRESEKPWLVSQLQQLQATGTAPQWVPVTRAMGVVNALGKALSREMVWAEESARRMAFAKARREALSSLTLMGEALVQLESAYGALDEILKDEVAADVSAGEIA